MGYYNEIYRLSHLFTLVDAICLPVSAFEWKNEKKRKRKKTQGR